MSRTLVTLFRLLGYPVGTLVVLLMLSGPAIFLNWVGQHSANVAYVLAYLLAFYAPAMATGFNKGIMFSTKTLIAGARSVGLLVILHLGSLLFHFNFFGAPFPLVFLLALALETGIIVPKRRG